MNDEDLMCVLECVGIEAGLSTMGVVHSEALQAKRSNLKHACCESRPSAGCWSCAAQTNMLDVIECVEAEHSRDQTKTCLPPLVVVLDLDQTLIHSFHDSDMPHDFRIGDNGLNCVYVARRPGVIKFLDWLQRPGIVVALYTAGQREYVRNILEVLDPNGTLFQQVKCRRDCLVTPMKGVYSKDLRKFTDDMSRVVLVDNSPWSFHLQPRNGILVKDWRGHNSDDSEMSRVQRVITRLLTAEDVREALIHEKEIEPFMDTLSEMRRVMYPNAAKVFEEQDT